MPSLKPFVIIESPFAGNIDRNITYARAAIRDSLLHGECPFASHLLYTQPGVLKDDVPEERALGIEAGLTVGLWTCKTIVYDDLGISPGMQKGIEAAKQAGRAIEYRKVPDWKPA